MPAAGPYSPGAQGRQTLALALEKRPTGHTSQAELPGSLAYVPDAHASHATEALRDAKLPGSQNAQTADPRESLNRPAQH